MLRKNLLIAAASITFGLSCAAAQATPLALNLSGTLTGYPAYNTASTIGLLNSAPFSLSAVFDSTSGVDGIFMFGQQMFSPPYTINYYGSPFTLAVYPTTSIVFTVNGSAAPYVPTLPYVVIGDPSDNYFQSYLFGIGTPHFIFGPYFYNSSFYESTTLTVSNPFTQLNLVPTVFNPSQSGIGGLLIDSEIVAISSLTSVSITPVPEPGSLAILLAGLACLACCRAIRPVKPRS